MYYALGTALVCYHGNRSTEYSVTEVHWRVINNDNQGNAPAMTPKPKHTIVLSLCIEIDKKLKLRNVQKISFFFVIYLPIQLIIDTRL